MPEVEAASSVVCQRALQGSKNHEMNASDWKSTTSGQVLSSTGVFAALGGVIWLASHTWPIVAYLAASCAALWFMRRRRSPWSRAARSVLIPSALAFAFMTCALLVVSLSVEGLDRPLPEVRVVEFELFLLRFSEIVNPWVSLGAFFVCSILLFLLCTVRFFPQWKPVSRFLAFRRYSARLSAALSIIASFTLCGHALHGSVVARIRDHVTAVYTDSRNVETDLLAHVVAWKAARSAFSDLPPSVQRYLPPMLDALRALPLKDGERAELTRYVARRAVGGSAPLDDIVLENLTSSSPALRTLRDATPGLFVLRQGDTVTAEAFREQLKNERTAREVLAAEERAAMEEILSTTFASVPDAAKSVAKELLKGIVDTEASLIAREVGEYLGKVADNYFERATEPIVKQSASRILDALRRHRDTPVRTIVSRAVRELGLDAPRALMWRIWSKLGPRLSSPFGLITEPELAATRADLNEAQRLVEAFGRVASELSPAPTDVPGTSRVTPLDSGLALMRSNLRTLETRVAAAEVLLRTSRPQGPPGGGRGPRAR